jgi:hypothetical protein
MSDEQLTSKQRRRAEKRRREKEAKTGGGLPSPASPVKAVSSSSSVVSKPPKLQGGVKWNFSVDYNDHFETPLAAYQDIKPLLQRLAAALKNDPKELVIYDPYFCAGGMLGLLEQTGFPNVINKNRDFYVDVAKKLIPTHDILVTNPPYSGEHKPKLLNYLLSTIQNSNNTTLQPKPFALLLPIYTATKNYWKEFAFEFVRQTSDPNSLFYLVPPDCYEYQHPEGTGKDIPPFKSAWFIGLPTMSNTGGGVDVMEVRRALESATATASSVSSATASAGSARARGGCTVYATVDQLAAAGHVVVDRRPNPKQRKKMMKMRAAGAPAGVTQPSGGQGGDDGARSGTGDDMPSQKKRRY